jgi:hypothetical protein
MPYRSQINKLDALIRTIDNDLFSLEKSGSGDPSKINELKKQQIEYKTELRRLNRLQWDHDHNTIDYGDDR